MSNFEIATQLVSVDGLIPQREIRVGEKKFNTPARATPVRLTREGESPLSESKQVCELHKAINSERLATERQGDETPITDGLKRGANKTETDDPVIVFLTYTDAAPLEKHEAEQVVDLMAEFSDFVTIPLMPELQGMVDEGEGVEDEAFQHYVTSARRIIDAAQESYPTLPVMGVLPTLGRVHVSHLFEIYLAEGLRAFCFNFNGGQATASTKVNLLRPLMREIGRRDLQNAVLFYAINLKSGHQDDDLGGAPAEDVGAVGLGFDIVGENHVGVRAPPEVFEEMAEDEEASEDTFELFDRERFVHADVPFEQLVDEFPEESNFEPAHILNRARNNDNHRRRLEKLVTAEQIALALRDLQESDREAVFEELAGRPGISPQAVSAARTIRGEFDAGANQSGLDEFT